VVDSSQGKDTIIHEVEQACCMDGVVATGFGRWMGL